MWCSIKIHSNALNKGLPPDTKAQNDSTATASMSSSRCNSKPFKKDSRDDSKG
jgi:hypothetical protein